MLVHSIGDIVLLRPGNQDLASSLNVPSNTCDQEVGDEVHELSKEYRLIKFIVK